MKPSKLYVATLVVANIIGIFAFIWPFVVPLHGDIDAAHGKEGTLILLSLLACLGALLFVEMGRGGMGPKAVALIGVLGAAMVALRLPGYIAGFSAMFVVVLVAGNAFGPGFGFLLGAVGMFASGLFIGGIGPWLPFQMVAVGWVGMGAGVVPKGNSWATRLGALATYGFATGFLFGAVMNMWDWPFIAGSAGNSSISWIPGGSVADNLHHYLRYYTVTSLWWDTFRAVGNVVLILALGRPLLGTLDRAARRMHLQVREVPATAGTAGTAPTLGPQ